MREIDPPSGAFTRLFLVIAVLLWAGLLLRLGISIQRAMVLGLGVSGGVWSYLWYFTIWTNLLAAMVVSATLIPSQQPTIARLRSAGFATMTTAAMTIVGVAYYVLLSHTRDPQGWALVADMMLHYLAPSLMLLFWWLAVPKCRVAWSQLPLWLVYPFVYTVYLLLRGVLSDRYPYYFVDVAKLGYLTVLQNIGGLVVAYLVVGVVLVAAARVVCRGEGVG